MIGTYLIAWRPLSAKAIFDPHDHHKMCGADPVLVITYGWRLGCYRSLMLPGGAEVMEHKLTVLMWPQRYVHIKRKYITIKHDTPGVYSTTPFTFHCQCKGHAAPKPYISFNNITNVE